MDHFLTVLLYSKVTVKSKKGKLGKFNLSQEKKKKKEERLLLLNMLSKEEKIFEGGGKEADRFKKNSRI